MFPHVQSVSFQFVPIASLSLLVTPLLRQPRIPLFLFYHKGSWLARVHLGAPPSTGLSCRHPLQTGCLSGSWGCSSPRAALSTLILVELHEAPACPLFQPVRDSLGCTTTLWCTSHSSQFGIISKPAEGTDCPQTIDEHVEEDCTQY